MCATFTPLASPSGMSYSDMGLAPSTSYSYRVFAVDAAGNNGPYSPVATTTTQLGPSGLVAAYGFNEGSGTTTADASGNGLTGTLNGAAWTTLGKFGNALSFNGSSNYVDLGNPTPLKLTGSMTWSAWIYATANPADDGQIIAKSGGTNGTLGSQFKTSPDTGPHTFGVAVSGDGIDERAALFDIRAVAEHVVLRDRRLRRDESQARRVREWTTRRRRAARHGSGVPIRSSDEREHRSPQRRLLLCRPDRRGAHLQPRSQRA